MEAGISADLMGQPPENMVLHLDYGTRDAPVFMESYMTIDDAKPMITREKLLFKVNEACHALGIGRSSFYEEQKAGRLIITRAAGRTLVHRRDLNDYAEARRAESISAPHTFH